MNITHYAKAIGQILAAGLGILVAALSDGTLSTVEFVTVLIGVVTAVSVYLVPNLPAGPGRYLKFGTSLAGAALAALLTILAPGIGLGQVSLADWLVIVLAVLAAAGVGIVPNTAKVSNYVTVTTGGNVPSVVGQLRTAVNQLNAQVAGETPAAPASPAGDL